MAFLYYRDPSCRAFLLALWCRPFSQTKLQFEALLNETGTKAAIIKTGLKDKKERRKKGK